MQGNFGVFQVSERTCERVTDEAITHSPDLLIRPACIRLKAARTSSGIQSAASTSKRSSALVLTLFTGTEKNATQHFSGRLENRNALGFSESEHTILPTRATAARKLRVDAVAWNDQRRWEVGPTL